MLAFISFPVTPVTSILFGAVMGFFWLSTVAPTNGIIAVMFGTRWLATLAGLAFFSHQVGGFLGVWLGGLAYVQTGSYDLVWWLSDAVRRALGRDQSADRGEAGAAPRRGFGMRTKGRGATAASKSEAEERGFDLQPAARCPGARPPSSWSAAA